MYNNRPAPAPVRKVNPQPQPPTYRAAQQQPPVVTQAWTKPATDVHSPPPPYPASPLYEPLPTRAAPTLVAPEPAPVAQHSKKKKARRFFSREKTDIAAPNDDGKLKKVNVDVDDDGEHWFATDPEHKFILRGTRKHDHLISLIV